MHHHEFKSSISDEKQQASVTDQNQVKDKRHAYIYFVLNVPAAVGKITFSIKNKTVT